MFGHDLGSKRNPSLKFILWLMLFHQFISSFAYPVSKAGLDKINPFAFAFFRFTIAAAIFCLILALRQDKEKIPFSDHVRLAVIGLLLIPGNQLIFLIGQSMTTAAHGSLLFATTPIFIYVLAIFILGERFTFRRAVGILIAAAGVYVIMSGGKIQFGAENLAGDLLILIAVLAWALGTILGKPLAQKYGAFRATALSLTYGGLIYFPYGAYKIAGLRMDSIPILAWLSIFYMAVVISVAAYFIWYWILKYVEASRVAVLQNIQPIIATSAGAIFLSEPISREFILGGIIVIGGVLLTELK
jgi:drug/metabolite transporter (DMT)-like permease